MGWVTRRNWFLQVDPGCAGHPGGFLQVNPGCAGHPDGFLQVNPGCAGHPDGFLQVKLSVIYSSRFMYLNTPLTRVKLLQLRKTATMLDADAGWNPLYLSTITGEFLVATAAAAAARPELVRPRPPSISWSRTRRLDTRESLFQFLLLMTLPVKRDEDEDEDEEIIIIH